MTWQAFERWLHCIGAANRQWDAIQFMMRECQRALDDPSVLALQAQVDTFRQMADNWRTQLYEYLQEDHEPQLVLKEIKVPRIAVERDDDHRANRSKRAQLTDKRPVSTRISRPL